MIAYAIHIHYTRSGLDSFLADASRRGKRYGLATHPAAVTSRGNRPGRLS